MSVKYFTKDDILKAIYAKYGTLEELAVKLKTSKQNISAKLNRQSPKFLNELQSVGIVIYNKDESKTLIKDNVVVYQANRIMELEKENEQLKEENAKLRVHVVSNIKKNKGASVK